MPPDRWTRVQEIFEAALPHDLPLRRGIVDRLCGEDADLRADVESLLAADSDADMFLDTPALALALPSFGSRFAPGDSVGPFDLVARLGAGGMGEVFLATDRRLHRRVALKCLAADRALDSRRAVRLRREAQAAAAFNHPNVAAVYEVIEWEDVIAIAMELVEGETLDARLAAGPIAPAAIVDIAIQAAEALGEAHDHGVVHRDVKPSNIMITAKGRIKILDFGIATCAPGEESVLIVEGASATTTATGQIMGTAAYTSPEQVIGGMVDARADIFSLGATLYHLATGRRPFGNGTLLETLGAVVHSQPASLSRLNPAVPAGLAHVIEKCLQKRPEDRYQSAREMVADLAALVRIEGGTPRSHRTVSLRVIGCAVAILVAAVTAVMLLRTDARAPASGSVAVLPFIEISGSAETEYLVDGLTEGLISRLSETPGLTVIARASSFHYKGRPTDPQAAARELGVHNVVSGTLRQQGSDLSIAVEIVDGRNNRRVWGRMYERPSTDLLAVQEDIAQDIAGQLSARRAVGEAARLSKRVTGNPAAYELYLKGRYEWNKRTQQHHTQALGYFERAIAADPGFALAYAALADTYNFIGGRPDRERFALARAAALRALTLDDTVAEAHAALGVSRLLGEWDWPGSAREFERALELNSNYASAHQWYGMYYQVVAGRFDRASQEVALAERLDPLSAVMPNAAGVTFHLLRQYDRALDEYRKGLEIEPAFRNILIYRARTHGATGDYDKAIADFQTLLERSPANAETLAGLAEIHAIAGHRVEAELRFDALKRAGLASASDLAIVAAALDRTDEAFQWLDRAFADHSWTLVWLKVDPRFDRLRRDPRFDALVRRVGLP